MQIDVEQVAKLARLGLTEKEKEIFVKQLSAILEYAENLKKIDTQNIPPTSHAVPLKNVFREDKTVPCENVKDILANAPQEEWQMFRVPRILE